MPPTNDALPLASSGIPDRARSRDLAERILIFAPGGSNAAMAQRILARTGLTSQVCACMEDLCQAIEEGAGATLITAAALPPPAVERLRKALESQPSWSLLPLVVLFGKGDTPWSASWMPDLLKSLRGVTVLERPVQLITLINALQNLLEVRRRQYQVRDLLAELEDKIRFQHQAYHDSLTGLPNRALLRDRLEHAIAHAQRSGHLVAVMLMDLDRFKVINDSLGHETGDALLQAIAARLKSVLREQDTIARLGGDEFVVLLEELPNADRADRVGRKLLEVMCHSIQVNEYQLFVSASIGISLFPRDGEDASMLLRHADTALYRVKERGRNNLQFYTTAMTVRAQEKLTLEQALRHALDHGGLELHYQPRVSLKTGCITGLEALLRWHHPTLGHVPPAELVNLAEESGLIVPLSDWVLRTACTQVRTWRDQGLPKVPVAVNLSAGQFIQADLAEHIREVLDQTGLEANGLELELTENILMSDIGKAIRTLRELKGFGVRTAIDDFGTGYSSLSYLKCLPVDWLKIDKSFVRDIATDPDDATLTRAIIALAHNLNLKVIAEGVETEAQWAFLEASGCDEVQGYYFSWPVPVTQIESLLAQYTDLDQDIIPDKS